MQGFPKLPASMLRSRRVLHGESNTGQASPRTPTQRTFQPQEAVQPQRNQTILQPDSPAQKANYSCLKSVPNPPENPALDIHEILPVSHGESNTSQASPRMTRYFLCRHTGCLSKFMTLVLPAVPPTLRTLSSSCRNQAEPAGKIRECCSAGGLKFALDYILVYYIYYRVGTVTTSGLVS